MIPAIAIITLNIALVLAALVLIDRHLNRQPNHNSIGDHAHPDDEDARSVEFAEFNILSHAGDNDRG